MENGATNLAAANSQLRQRVVDAMDEFSRVQATVGHVRDPRTADRNLLTALDMLNGVEAANKAAFDAAMAENQANMTIAEAALNAGNAPGTISGVTSAPGGRGSSSAAGEAGTSAATTDGG
jgi:hypothetical protein